MITAILMAAALLAGPGSDATLPATTGTGPAIDWTPPMFTIDPAQAGPGELRVSVRVRASKPVPYTIGMSMGLANGTAYAPVFFDAGRTIPVVFQPGETEQIVTLPLRRALNPGRTVIARLGGSRNSLNNVPVRGADGIVTGSTRPTAALRRLTPTPRFVPAAKTAGRTRIVSDDFLGPIGPKPGDGWRTVLTGGRYIGNGGTGVIVDDVAYPGVKSHPILTDETGRRRRVLRQFDCNVIHNQRRFAHCLTTLTSNGLFTFRRGDYVTVRARFDVRNGVQFAVWAMAENGWPPEIDFPETCLHMIATKCRLSVNQHFTSAAGKHVMYGYSPGIAPDGKWHDYGLDWTRDGTLIFLLDGIELFREPSATDVPMHLIVGGEIEMGGAGGFSGEARAWLDRVEVWR